MCDAKEISKKTYKMCFKHINAIVITNVVGVKDYTLVIDGQDLQMLKKELAKILFIDEINYVPSSFNVGPDKDFHVMFGFKGHASIRFLYSLRNSELVVRKNDVYPKAATSRPRFEVFRFNMTNSARDILKRYEDKLPKGGDFYNELPPPD